MGAEWAAFGFGARSCGVKVAGSRRTGSALKVKMYALFEDARLTSTFSVSLAAEA